MHFWSTKGVYLLQNANNVNFKLFLGCIHDPQSKDSAFFQEEFWMINNFESHLNQRFWRLKKAVQYVPNGEGGRALPKEEFWIMSHFEQRGVKFFCCLDCSNSINDSKFNFPRFDLVSVVW